MKTFRYLDVITAAFVAVLIISNVASSKIVQFGPFGFDGGTLLFPLSYIFSDILTEVYGYARARRVVWIGFACILLMAAVFMIVGRLPPAADWSNQTAYDAILGLTPRIVLASIVAYLVGSFSNDVILAKMKVWTGGRMLWTRTIASTVVGEFLDSALFVAIAFWGVLPMSLLITVAVSNYVFKTLVEVVFTPATYRIVKFLKRAEQEDYFDRDTDFNPLKIRV
jgi:uncharacterized integral membrane protein (TIGR00697 family)